MTEEQRRIIEENPIGVIPQVFRETYISAYGSPIIPSNPLSALQQRGCSLADVQEISISLLTPLKFHRASTLLPSRQSSGSLSGDLSRLAGAINSNAFIVNRIEPLFRAVLAEKPDEVDIWTQARNATIEPTPPPSKVASSTQQTPWVLSTAGITNSSERRCDVDELLKAEVGPMYDGLDGFFEHFFRKVPGLEETSRIVFNDCKNGPDPLFDEQNNTWCGWPETAHQNAVISWLQDICKKLAKLAKDHLPISDKRELVACPDRPLEATMGRTLKRKLDIGFSDSPDMTSWRHVLIPGELKSNPKDLLKARLDLSAYVREVFAAQATRRFVMSFTLCQSLLTVWSYDRVGAIGSIRIDINACGERFVMIMLGFLCMSKEDLGFDPTFTMDNGRQVLSITRNGRVERLVVDEIMKRSHCIVGRATTCWKAHPEDNPQETLVIKDAWQYAECPEEGDLLRMAAEKNTDNVARYYHHETVYVDGEVDCVEKNIRGGLDITKAANYQPSSSISRSTSLSQSRGESTVRGKRTSSQRNAALPESKRCRLAPQIEDSRLPRNRIHRRVILADYGTPIFTAKSPVVLAKALADCIKGHQSLLDAGLLHRDISINNLMIGENDRGFLIDLDLAIKVGRDGVSGAKGKAGTRAFMAIRTLLGHQHSFMHDLESFFWVVFWICIHYEKSGQPRVVEAFDRWNYATPESLAVEKLGTVADDEMFERTTADHVTPFYASCIPMLNRLRQAVFPNGKLWDPEKSTVDLYSEMIGILTEEAPKQN